MELRHGEQGDESYKLNIEEVVRQLKSSRFHFAGNNINKIR